MRPQYLFAVVFSTLALRPLAAQAPAPAPAAGAMQPPAAGAQTPAVGAQPAQAPQTPATATPVQAGAVQPEGYSYEPAGRRDPFINLLGTGLDPHPQAGHRPEGPAGMSAAEVMVSGVLQSRGSLVAMITGPDKKTYVVHAGEKLLDGTIKTITPQGLVIVQQVNDPLSLVKQREIRKLLRSLEDAKE